MPFVAAEQPKCPKCGKSVYTAEERIAANAKWHKTCFKCGGTDCVCGQTTLYIDGWSGESFHGLCHKLLDSTNVTEHSGELFCRHCYGRKYGPKGVGFGGGAGALSMDVGEHLGNKTTEMTNAHHSGNF